MDTKTPSWRTVLLFQQERQGSNLRPFVLETNALPIELRSFIKRRLLTTFTPSGGQRAVPRCISVSTARYPSNGLIMTYFVSRCKVCFWQRLQYF